MQGKAFFESVCTVHHAQTHCLPISDGETRATVMRLLRFYPFLALFCQYVFSVFCVQFGISFTSMMGWSNEKNIDFDEDYCSFPCLWMASSAISEDRVKRSDCLQFLKNKYEMGTTKAALNKIKSLRSYF
jgi:hypothetical protein